MDQTIKNTEAEDLNLNNVIITGRKHVEITIHHEEEVTTEIEQSINVMVQNTENNVAENNLNKTTENQVEIAIHHEEEFLTEIEQPNDDMVQNTYNNIHVGEVSKTTGNQNEIMAINEETTIAEEEQSNDSKMKTPKAKKGMANPDTWSKNLNKKLRMEGKAYKGVKKVNGKKTHCADKTERIQGQRNCSKRCKSKRKCFDISDSFRQEIFQGFWNRMDWREKQCYVASLVNKCEVQKSQEDSRRKFTYRYHFRVGENKLPVCKDLFLSTLGIGEYTVYEWLKKTDEHGLPKKIERASSVREESAEVKFAREFFELLPKMPSHYCRSTSSKVYLEPVFTSFADLYRVYSEHCVEKEQSRVGRLVLQRIFDQMNLSLFKPKKDQCDVCVGYETKNVNEEEYTNHIRRKDVARAEKEKDKKRALESDTVKVLTMDVQSVLLSPKIEASAMYYKTKLSCHNFTLYDMKTKDVKCYFWHEGEGGLTANSFSSCLNNHIESIIKPETEEIVLFSDGCGYQNRNATLSNTLLRLAVKYKVTMTQKFLEKGHTQMEVDSVHSTIERCINRRPIYSPSNYVELFRFARAKQPYDVMYLDHTFFGDFSSLKYYDNIRPGNKVGDPVVTDIRCLRYLPEGLIQYKLSFDDEFNDLPKRRNAKVPSGDEDVAPLYRQPLQIKNTKYEHLQQLKSVIPKDYHAFYDSLSHGI
jgi:hypothetical protein